MFFNQASNCELKAKLKSAAAASQLEISVTYKDNTDDFQPEAIVETNDTTAVTLLAAPSSGIINIVNLIKIYNPDTQSNTVEILANDTVVYTCAVGAGESTMLPQAGIINGGYVPADGSLYTNSTTDMPMISNNSVDTDNDIDFSAGFCYDLSTKEKIVSAATTKQLDTIFAEGYNAGGLDTGSKANSTWYHCFAISKADGTPDFLFSTSATSPAMPSGFVNKRRIGSIMTNSSGNIIQFYQNGNHFEFKYVITEYSSNNPPISATDLIITTPLGIVTQAILTFYTDTNGSGPIEMNAVSKLTGQDSTVVLAQADTVPYVTGITPQVRIWTNTSSQIQHYKSTPYTAYTYQIKTLGYIDNRVAN